MDSASSSRVATRMSRRAHERYPVPPSVLTATWLIEGQKVQGQGVLEDISAGGCSSWMSNPPPQGRLLHARLELKTREGAVFCVIDADLKVCKRRYVSPSEPFGWVVSLATESIHPADGKRMTDFIETIKTSH